MPKRSREDKVKVTPPLSALAARRLRSQDAAALPVPKAPETKKKAPRATPAKNGSPSPATATRTATNSEPKSTDYLAEKRRETEGKLREQVKAQAQARPALEYDNTRLGESVLARMRRSKSGDTVGLVVTPVDEDMLDAVEPTELRSDSDMEGKTNTQVDLGGGRERSTPKLTQVSIFTPTEKNHTQAPEKGIFRLLTGETLVILGEYTLQVTKGTITLSGATLTIKSGPHAVYSPSTHSLPVIECPGQKEKKNSGKDEEFDAEITVTSQNLCSGLRGVGKICSMFRGIWTPVGMAKGNGTFFPLFSTTYSVPILSTPKSWESCYEALARKIAESSSFSSTPPVILITGSKGTGKSTFARTLVNKLLTSPTSACTSVAYLDVDPGQPEFSPSGFVSLHKLTTPIFGPPFTHPNPGTVVRLHHTGYTSPKEDPGHYIACVMNLISTYRELLDSATTAEDTRIPLVVNTAGWTKGLGLELLGDILLHSQASDVVFLYGALESKNPVSDLVSESVQLHELENASSSAAPTRFSAADLRMLQIMSYMHHDPDQGKWDFGTPLTAVPPWIIDYVGPETGIDAIAVLGEDVVPEELITAVDGTLVGVVLVDEHDLSPPIPAPDTDLPYLVDAPLPESSFSAGLALIRGVDVKNRCIHLLTSIREEEISRWEQEGLRIVLVRGRLEIPVWGMVGAGTEGAPWISVGAVVGAGGKGAEVWRVRRNVMRRGQVVRELAAT